MAKTICKILGVVFLLVGVVGFMEFGRRLLGAHLYPTHNAVHIVSGVAALYFGFAGTLSAARTFSLIFGIVYLALGILGLVLGEPPDRMWHPLNVLELGTSDHAIHILLGVLFLAGGLFTKRS